MQDFVHLLSPKQYIYRDFSHILVLEMKDSHVFVRIYSCLSHLIIDASFQNDFTSTNHICFHYGWDQMFILFTKFKLNTIFEMGMRIFLFKTYFDLNLTM